MRRSPLPGGVQSYLVRDKTQMGNSRACERSAFSLFSSEYRASVRTTTRLQPSRLSMFSCVTAVYFEGLQASSFIDPPSILIYLALFASLRPCCFLPPSRPLSSSTTPQTKQKNEVPRLRNKHREWTVAHGGHVIWKCTSSLCSFLASSKVAAGRYVCAL